MFLKKDCCREWHKIYFLIDTLNTKILSPCLWVYILLKCTSWKTEYYNEYVVDNLFFYLFQITLQIDWY